MINQLALIDQFITGSFTGSLRGPLRGPLRDLSREMFRRLLACPAKNPPPHYECKTPLRMPEASNILPAKDQLILLTCPKAFKC